MAGEGETGDALADEGGPSGVAEVDVEALFIARFRSAIAIVNVVGSRHNQKGKTMALFVR
jgi:hypothetical protein